MNLEQAFELPLPPADAWPLFKDVPMLVGCLPGAALTGPADPAALPLSFAIRLGPMGASFAGTGAVAFDDAAQAGSFSGSALDKRTQSRVKGEARFALAAAGDGTRVTVLVDYTLTGPLAQFSRGAVLREVANQLTLRFADNLRDRIAQSAALGTVADVAAGGAPVADAAPGADAPPPFDAAPLSDAVSPAGAAPLADAGSREAASQPADAAQSAAALSGAMRRRAAADTATSPASASPPVPSLDVFALLRAALRAWFARLFRRSGADPRRDAP